MIWQLTSQSLSRIEDAKQRQRKKDLTLQRAACKAPVSYKLFLSIRLHLGMQVFGRAGLRAQDRAGLVPHPTSSFLFLDSLLSLSLLVGLVADGTS